MGFGFAFEDKILFPPSEKTRGTFSNSNFETRKKAKV